MKKELYSKGVIVKRNVLNELRSRDMTIQELRFFSIYLSKIDPNDESTRLVRFSLSDFQKIMDFDRLNVKQLKDTTDSLLSKIVKVPLDPDDPKRYVAFQLFKECRVDRDEKGNWYIEIDAHDKALPLMFNFKKEYFKYKLWNVLRLKSPNQVRMFEILKQYESIGKRELTVDELKELLGIEKNQYSSRNGIIDFKNRVLNPCQQALKENTDICFTYEAGKTGRGGKWLSIVFYISKNEHYKDPLSLDEFIDLPPDPVIIEADVKIKEQPEPKPVQASDNEDISIKREEICQGFSSSAFNVFTDSQLVILKRLTTPLIDQQRIGLGLDLAILTYLLEKINSAKVDSIPDDQLFEHIKSGVLNELSQLRS